MNSFSPAGTFIKVKRAMFNCLGGIYFLQTCREHCCVSGSKMFGKKKKTKLEKKLNTLSCCFQRYWTQVFWLSVGPTGWWMSPPVSVSVEMDSQRTAADQVGNWTTIPVRRVLVIEKNSTESSTVTSSNSCKNLPI